MAMTFERVCGDFPSYADAPAWEGEGGTLPDGSVVVVWLEGTGSLGAILHAGEGPPARAGVYQPGNGGRGAKRLRDATQEEAEAARDCVLAEREAEKAREAEYLAEEARKAPLLEAWKDNVRRWYAAHRQEIETAVGPIYPYHPRVLALAQQDAALLAERRAIDGGAGWPYLHDVLAECARTIQRYTL